MLSELSLPEYLMWRKFWELDPQTQERADIRAARIAHVVACAFQGKGRKPQLTDFITDYGKETVRQSPEHMRASLMMYADAHNAYLRQGGT